MWGSSFSTGTGRGKGVLTSAASTVVGYPSGDGNPSSGGPPPTQSMMSQIANFVKEQYLPCGLMTVSGSSRAPVSGTHSPTRPSHDLISMLLYFPSLRTGYHPGQLIPELRGGCRECWSPQREHDGNLHLVGPDLERERSQKSALVLASCSLRAHISPSRDPTNRIRSPPASSSPS